MTPHAGQRLLIAPRRPASHAHRRPTPTARPMRPLQPGEARLAIEHFALTANNITYAAFGEAMKYWQFFPRPTRPGAACRCGALPRLPSRRPRAWPSGAASGATFRPARTWSCSPCAPGARASSTPPRTGRSWPRSTTSTSAATPTPPGKPQTEGLQAVLRPLFTTSFLIDDFLADSGFFGARQLLLSSASSKTAYGTAFCLAQRRGTPGTPAVVGLTSAGNLDFTRSLGCYDDVCAYGDAADARPAAAHALHRLRRQCRAAPRRARALRRRARLQQLDRRYALDRTRRRRRPARAAPGAVLRAGADQEAQRAAARGLGPRRPATAPGRGLGSVHRPCRPCRRPLAAHRRRSAAPRRCRRPTRSLLNGQADARAGLMLTLQP